MIDERAQLEIMAAALEGITEGRLAATPESIARPLPALISKDFRLSLRHLVACAQLEEPPDCTAVREAGRRVGEAAGKRMAEPMVLVWHDGVTMTIRGRVALWLKTASSV